MPREPVEYTRKSSVKSPAIFYLAVEGQKTEVHYFLELNHKLRDSRFKLEVVPRLDPTHSAPKHVLASMKSHIQGLESRSADDQFWIVIDRDSWPDKQLMEVSIEAAEKKIKIAFSNPCFEVWLLFHFYAIANLGELKKISKKRNIKDKLVSALRAALGQYNPNKPPFEILYPMTKAAIENAISVTPEEQWFESIGSSVHVLMSELHHELGFKIE